MTEQFIEIAGQKMVLLNRAEYVRLAGEAENYRDICAAVEARERREAGEEYVPANLVNRILDGENALKAWRQHRGLSQEELGARVGRGGSFVSKLERGENGGDIRLWQALARELKVELTDIAPAD